MRNRNLIALTVAVVLAGCAKSPESPVNQHGDEVSRQSEAGEVSVQVGAVAELCFDARKDDEVVFRFEADQPLQFNFHYHIDDEVYYPVPEHETAAEKGVYLVPKDETYCMMWTNSSSATAKLSAQVEGVKNLAWY